MGIKKWHEFINEDAFQGEVYKKYQVVSMTKYLNKDSDINRKFNEIKYLLGEIDYHDIKLELIEKRKYVEEAKEYLDIYTIKYSDTINDKIEILKKMFSHESEIISIFEDEFNHSFNPIIGIAFENFNRFHWIKTKSLPISLRKISLGYKIYKKVIEYFHYIASADDANHLARKIWHHLLKDEELYCAVDIDSYLVFYKNYCTDETRNEIKEILIKFFNNPSKFEYAKTGIDREFQEYLQLTENDEILWKVKEISV